MPLLRHPPATGGSFAMQPTTRLQNAMNIGGMSNCSLRAVLSELLDDAPSTRAIETAAAARFKKRRTHIDLPCLEGEPFRWTLCNPNVLLTMLLEESKALQTWYEEAWRTHPCSHENPWHLLIGFDEFTPGNKLAQRPERKSMVLSYSFRELGPNLHRSAAWVTPLVVRSTMVNRVSGGWSAMLRAY